MSHAWYFGQKRNHSEENDARELLKRLKQEIWGDGGERVHDTTLYEYMQYIYDGITKAKNVDAYDIELLLKYAFKRKLIDTILLNKLNSLIQYMCSKRMFEYLQYVLECVGFTITKEQHDAIIRIADDETLKSLITHYYSQQQERRLHLTFAYADTFDAKTSHLLDVLEHHPMFSWTPAYFVISMFGDALFNRLFDDPHYKDDIDVQTKAFRFGVDVGSGDRSLRIYEAGRVRATFDFEMLMIDCPKKDSNLRLLERLVHDFNQYMTPLFVQILLLNACRHGQRAMIQFLLGNPLLGVVEMSCFTAILLTTNQRLENLQLLIAHEANRLTPRFVSTLKTYAATHRYDQNVIDYLNTLVQVENPYEPYTKVIRDSFEMECPHNVFPDECEGDENTGLKDTISSECMTKADAERGDILKIVGRGQDGKVTGQCYLKTGLYSWWNRGDGVDGKSWNDPITRVVPLPRDAWGDA